MEFVVLLLLIGFVGTFFSGLIGMGGAIINYPMLLYVPALFGVAEFSAHDVSGMIAWQVLFASLSSLIAFRKEKMIHLPLVTVMGAASLVGSFAGGYGAKFLSGEAVNLVYAVLALAAAVMMFVSVGARRGEGAAGGVAAVAAATGTAATGGAGGTNARDAVVGGVEGDVAAGDGAVESAAAAGTGATAKGMAPPFNKVAAATIALAVGVVSGIVGLGGGFLLIPALLLLLRIPLRMAIASTIAIGFISSLATNVGKMMAGPVPLLPSAILVSMSLIAAPLGIAVGKRMKSKTLKKVAGTVVLAASIKIWADILW
jgi:uncharacterized membrane protein YfcA